MAAIIKASEVRWAEPIQIDFGFSGLSEDQATTIMRQLIREKWDENIRRKDQCVYVIRITGDVAPLYGKKVSRTVYIGEGKAKGRLRGHAQWLAPLVRSVPQMGIEIRVAEVARRKHATLYQYIEADLIKWFFQKYGALPWFNLQRERSKEGHYEYEPDAKRELVSALGVGSGTKVVWAIQPTKNHPSHEHFTRGLVEDE